MLLLFRRRNKYRRTICVSDAKHYVVRYARKKKLGKYVYIYMVVLLWYEKRRFANEAHTVLRKRRISHNFVVFTCRRFIRQFYVRLWPCSVDPSNYNFFASSKTTRTELNVSNGTHRYAIGENRSIRVYVIRTRLRLAVKTYANGT